MVSIHAFKHLAGIESLEMGGCTWLYVLSDSDEEHFYVGMTYRLVTRLQEHMACEGAQATKKWAFDTVQAVYKINDEREHDHSLEDALTLKIMKGRGGAWWKIRGGRWHQTSKIPKPQQLVDMRHFPEFCICHYPVAEKTSKAGRRFACCARKDVDWLQNTSVGETCKFADSDCDYFRWMDE